MTNFNQPPKHIINLTTKKALNIKSGTIVIALTESEVAKVKNYLQQKKGFIVHKKNPPFTVDSSWFKATISKKKKLSITSYARNFAEKRAHLEAFLSVIGYGLKNSAKQLAPVKNKPTPQALQVNAQPQQPIQPTQKQPNQVSFTPPIVSVQKSTKQAPSEIINWENGEKTPIKSGGITIPLSEGQIQTVRLYLEKHDGFQIEQLSATKKTSFSAKSDWFNISVKKQKLSISSFVRNFAQKKVELAQFLAVINYGFEPKDLFEINANNGANNKKTLVVKEAVQLTPKENLNEPTNLSTEVPTTVYHWATQQSFPIKSGSIVLALNEEAINQVQNYLLDHPGFALDINIKKQWVFAVKSVWFNVNINKKNKLYISSFVRRFGEKRAELEKFLAVIGYGFKLKVPPVPLTTNDQLVTDAAQDQKMPEALIDSSPLVADAQVNTDVKENIFKQENDLTPLNLAPVEQPTHVVYVKTKAETLIKDGAFCLNINEKLFVKVKTYLDKLRSFKDVVTSDSSILLAKQASWFKVVIQQNYQMEVSHFLENFAKYQTKLVKFLKLVKCELVISSNQLELQQAAIANIFATTPIAQSPHTEEVPQVSGGDQSTLSDLSLKHSTKELEADTPAGNDNVVFEHVVIKHRQDHPTQTLDAKFSQIDQPIVNNKKLQESAQLASTNQAVVNHGVVSYVVHKPTNQQHHIKNGTLEFKIDKNQFVNLERFVNNNPDYKKLKNNDNQYKLTKEADWCRIYLNKNNLFKIQRFVPNFQQNQKQLAELLQTIDCYLPTQLNDNVSTQSPQTKALVVPVTLPKYVINQVTCEYTVFDKGNCQFKIDVNQKDLAYKYLVKDGNFQKINPKDHQYFWIMDSKELFRVDLNQKYLLRIQKYTNKFAKIKDQLAQFLALFNYEFADEVPKNLLEKVNNNQANELKTPNKPQVKIINAHDVTKPNSSLALVTVNSKQVAPTYERGAIQYDPMNKLFPDHEQPLALIYGSDESGKSDYFGGISVCLFYLSLESLNILYEHNLLTKAIIKDSKNYSTDAEIKKVAEKILAIDALQPYIFVECPTVSEYNDLFKTLNCGNSSNQRLLVHLNNNLFQRASEAHANNIPWVIDRFCDLKNYFLDQTYINTFVSDPSWKLNLDYVKKHLFLQEKGEAKYAAIAIASILARYHFLKQIEALEEKYQITIPLGSPEINKPYFVSAIKEIIKTHGNEFFKDVVKCNDFDAIFKTLEQIEGN